MLKIENLKVHYGPIGAVRGVNLEVDQGKIVTLLGPNGAGKTSVLNSVMGLVPVTDGKVFFMDKEITSLAPERIVRQGMTLVPEGRRIFPNLTVAENLRIGCSFRREREKVKADLSEILEMFPILGIRNEQMAGTLSGGEQQQLAVARALMSGPSLLMLDEPSLGLAPQIVDTIFELIANLRNRGLTILLVEQNAERSLEIADYGYVLTNGRITSSGSASDIISSEDVERAYMGLE